MKKFLKVFFSIIGILVLVLVIAWTAVDISKYIFMPTTTTATSPPATSPTFTPVSRPRALPTSPAPTRIFSPATTASTWRSTT